MLGDPLAVHRVLRAARPDVVCLQESPRWPGSGHQLRRLAAAAGLSFVAGGRLSAGTSVLIGSGVMLDSAQLIRLPVRNWRTRPRGAVLVSLSLRAAPRPRLSVMCLHLGLFAQERAQHLRILRKRLAGQSLLALAGDLNEDPGGDSWTGFADLAHDPEPEAGPTFPAWDPKRRIDAILVSTGVRVLEYDSWRPDDRDLRLASDHRPVLAVLSTG